MVNFQDCYQRASNAVCECLTWSNNAISSPNNGRVSLYCVFSSGTALLQEVCKRLPESLKGYNFIHLNLSNLSGAFKDSIGLDFLGFVRSTKAIMDSWGGSIDERCSHKVACCMRDVSKFIETVVSREVINIEDFWASKKVSDLTSTITNWVGNNTGFKTDSFSEFMNVTLQAWRTAKSTYDFATSFKDKASTPDYNYLKDAGLGATWLVAKYNKVDSVVNLVTVVDGLNNIKKCSSLGG